VKQHWNLLKSRYMYENRIVKVREDTYHFLPNDIVQDFMAMEFSDWVNIIPVTPGNEVVMIRQYRHGIQRDTLEIPGGLISPDDSSPAEGAAREMEEETGYSSDHIVHIGTVEPNPAIQNNRCHTYLALNAIRVSGQNLDPTEAIRIDLIEKSKVYEMIKAGIITHSLVISAFAHLLIYEGKHTT